MTKNTAFIIGASSQLGREIARQLAQKGIELILLVPTSFDAKEMFSSIKGKTNIYPMDIYQPTQAIQKLEQIWRQHNGAQLVLVNTGVNPYNLELLWEPEEDIIHANVRGFAAMANTAFRLLRQQGYGQLAAINSIAGLRGGSSVAYHASKAFAQNYLEGLAMHAQRLKLPIQITDIQMGMLDKVATQGKKFWLLPLPQIAKQILRAIAKGKRKVYVPKRWIIIAWLTKLLPEFIYNTRRWKSKT